MTRLPAAVAFYSSDSAHQRAVEDPLRAHPASRVVTALLLGAVWGGLLLVAHDQVLRSMFLVKLLAAPFAFLFVVTAVELPRLLLGIATPDRQAPRGAGLAALVVVTTAAFLGVSALVAVAFLA